MTSDRPSSLAGDGGHSLARSSTRGCATRSPGDPPARRSPVAATDRRAVRLQLHAGHRGAGEAGALGPDRGRDVAEWRGSAGGRSRRSRTTTCSARRSRPSRSAWPASRRRPGEIHRASIASPKRSTCGPRRRTAPRASATPKGWRYPLAIPQADRRDPPGPGPAPRAGAVECKALFQATGTTSRNSPTRPTGTRSSSIRSAIAAPGRRRGDATACPHGVPEGVERLSGQADDRHQSVISFVFLLGPGHACVVLIYRREPV